MLSTVCAQETPYQFLDQLAVVAAPAYDFQESFSRRTECTNNCKKRYPKFVVERTAPLGAKVLPICHFHYTLCF